MSSVPVAAARLDDRVERRVVEFHPVEHQTLVATTDLDHLIFTDGAFALPLDEQRLLRERHLRAAYDHHVALCDPYAAFARRVLGHGGSPPSLRDIPLIPTAVFKDHAPLSVPPSEVAMYCMSSGTRGVQSTVGRDRVTLERLLGSLQAGIRLIESWHEDEVEVIHLGPDRKEAGDVWFLYVMSLIELLHPTRHFVRAGVLDATAATDRVFELLRRGEQHIAVVGPPFRVIEWLETLAKSGREVDAGSRMTVVTAGGWKRWAGTAMPRDAFDAQVCGALGLHSARQVRDAFNQVELNTVFMECTAHRKHVPPWVFATTRDPDQLAAQAPGVPGLLSYLDASATSYPAFLVTDDVGIVREGPCPCGRDAVTIEVARRLTTTAERGCALALGRQVRGAEGAELR